MGEDETTRVKAITVSCNIIIKPETRNQYCCFCLFFLANYCLWLFAVVPSCHTITITVRVLALQLEVLHRFFALKGLQR